MQLWTKNQDPSWERTVYARVIRGGDAVAGFNQKEYYKILLVNQGSALILSDVNRIVTAPAVILLDDEYAGTIMDNGADITTVFLKPTEIREEFTAERIHSGEFENQYGRTIYQDYLLVQSFERENHAARVLPLSLSAYAKISKTIGLMETELTTQQDGFWPCRSRSYLMELLYFISYVCADHGEEGESDAPAATETSILRQDADTIVNNETVSRIMVYLSEHIGDKITQEDIMKEFSLNRNLLNALFVKETSQTCMNYLTKMRVNLAQILLAETELQIGEIAGRVGYPDSNYFIKVFKKNTGVTPSKYRESFQ